MLSFAGQFHQNFRNLELSNWPSFPTGKKLVGLPSLILVQRILSRNFILVGLPKKNKVTHRTGIVTKGITVDTTLFQPKTLNICIGLRKILANSKKYIYKKRFISNGKGTFNFQLPPSFSFFVAYHFNGERKDLNEPDPFSPRTTPSWAEPGFYITYLGFLSLS